MAAVAQPMRGALVGAQSHPEYVISLKSLAAAGPVSFQGVPPRVCELLNMKSEPRPPWRTLRVWYLLQADLLKVAPTFSKKALD